MGSHYYADGALHKEVTRIGGNVTHISRMWNYADAVRHPKPRRPLHGLKLIPPRSGLVLDPTGKRYGPIPLMPTFDAYYALERMMEDERGYYWMICNWKIARRELDVSGSEHNPLIREKRLIRFLLSVVLGKPTLVRYFIEHCPDFVTAGACPSWRGRCPRSLTTARSTPSGCSARSSTTTRRSRAGRGCSTTISCAGSSQTRNWRGDRLRTSKFQRIVDPKAGPLIAIRMTVMSRKSLGGIQTDLESRVLKPDGEPIPGLYAAGEAAGFGGGGMHGKRSLEGTFLGGCVFSARIAARAIAEQREPATEPDPPPREPSRSRSRRSRWRCRRAAVRFSRSRQGTVADPPSPTTRLTGGPPGHVAVILMENEEYGDMIGSHDAPYINSLARAYALARSMFAITHPSLPNYLALTGGSTFGIDSDCTGCRVAASSIVDQLEPPG